MLRPSSFVGVQVDDRLVLGRGLHQQVGRLLALEDAIDVARRSPPFFELINSGRGRRSNFSFAINVGFWPAPTLNCPDSPRLLGSSRTHHDMFEFWPRRKRATIGAKARPWF